VPLKVKPVALLVTTASGNRASGTVPVRFTAGTLVAVPAVPAWGA
jgi:hypothetical protein